MPAYMVFTRERMRDEEEYGIYKQENRVAMEGHPIKKDVLNGKYKVLEGAEVQGVVILDSRRSRTQRHTTTARPIAKRGNIASWLPTIGSS